VANHTHHQVHHNQQNNSTSASGINMTTIVVTAASPSVNEDEGSAEGVRRDYDESQLNGCETANNSSHRQRATSCTIAAPLSQQTTTTTTTTTTLTASSTTPVPSAAADCHQRNLERNQSVTRTLLAVSISFTVCWMPLHILNALIDVGLVTHEHYFSEQQIYLMIAICSSIAMTSVPLNALLYGWYNPSINREVISWRLIANASICNFSQTANAANESTDGSRRNSGNNNSTNNHLVPGAGSNSRIRAASDAGPAAAGRSSDGDRV
jgi:hypothetical protein